MIKKESHSRERKVGRGFTKKKNNQGVVVFGFTLGNRESANAARFHLLKGAKKTLHAKEKQRASYSKKNPKEGKCAAFQKKTYTPDEP